MQCMTTVTYSINVNRELIVPFKVKRIRQGDPMSSFLFVLIIKYLSRLLTLLNYVKGFKYHPRCANIKLMKLGFVDDLLLFYRGDVQ